MSGEVNGQVNGQARRWPLSIRCWRAGELHEMPGNTQPYTRRKIVSLTTKLLRRAWAVTPRRLRQLSLATAVAALG